MSVSSGASSFGFGFLGAFAMTNQPSNGPKGPSMDLAPIRRSKIRPNTAFHMAPIPRKVYPLIGQIAVYHGEVERELDHLLAGLVAAIPDPADQGWERLQFLKRCSRLEKKAPLLFHDEPSLCKKLKDLTDEIRLRHAQRNIVVHGQYTAVFPKQGETRFQVKAKPFKEIALFEFNEDDLETIFHELGTLVGTLISFFDDSPNYMLSSQDKQLLRDRLQPHLPDRANFAKLPLRQITSPRK
ncbi:MAG: hypothetical protein O7D31_04070 [Alphaproteobacteria bacterium]|nr:hypothetical protein [Alphaproteobacteria bacterium]